jgi:hypothetical protein
MRLRERLAVLEQRFKSLLENKNQEHARQVFLEVGAAIHTEAGLLYERAEVPAPLRAAPWLHVIDKLIEEFPGDLFVKDSLVSAVEEYLKVLRRAVDTASF